MHYLQMVLQLYYLKNQNINALTIKHLKSYSHYNNHVFTHMNFHAEALHVTSTYEQFMEKMAGRAHKEALPWYRGSAFLPDISIPVCTS